MTPRRRSPKPLLLGTLSAVLALTAGLVLAPSPVAADDGPVVTQHRFTTSDGVELQTTLTSHAPAESRPTVVEFSPYGRGSETLSVPEEYNYLLVQIRGTGDSDGSFDALGPLSQRDVVEVLGWACEQPFSGGDLALAGFSASAIVLYNSWHTELPCVRAAVLRSGTHELYRDLLVPGGIVNLIPGAGVLAMIGAPALMQGPDRLERDPGSALDVVGGLFTSGVSAGLAHPTLDGWWQERGWRGDANDIPVLVVNGFFDVESRGAFEGYRALAADGAHLRMVGGHDGHPAGTDGGAGEAVRWLDEHVRGVDTGITEEPRVQLLLANGSRQAYLDGDYATYDGDSWPLPGTKWVDLALGGSALSPSGTLSLDRAPRSTKSWLTIPSVPTMTDMPNLALLGAGGLDLLLDHVPALTDMTVAESLGLTFTTGALTRDVVSAGPLSLELPLTTLVPETNLWAVLSDVGPDGVAKPLTVGRLSTAYPTVDATRSLKDDRGRIVQPYGDFSTKSPATPMTERRYHVELWPVGSRFKAGHRIRVQIVGASAASMPSLPSVNTVRLGGEDGARLLFPVLPGSDLRAALGATPGPEQPGPEQPGPGVPGAGQPPAGTLPVPAGTTASAPSRVRTLKVAGKPARQRRLISWRAPRADGGGSLTGYRVRVVCGTGAERRTAIDRLVGADRRRVTVKRAGLRPGGCRVVVRAVNEAGEGPGAAIRFRVRRG